MRKRGLELPCATMHCNRRQSSLGFQPVPRDHRAWPWEIGNDVRVAQRRRSVQDTGWKPMLLCSFASPSLQMQPLAGPKSIQSRTKKEGCLHSLPLHSQNQATFSITSRLPALLVSRIRPEDGIVDVV